MLESFRRRKPTPHEHHVRSAKLHEKRLHRKHPRGHFTFNRRNYNSLGTCSRRQRTDSLWTCRVQPATASCSPVERSAAVNRHKITCRVYLLTCQGVYNGRSTIIALLAVRSRTRKVPLLDIVYEIPVVCGPGSHTPPAYHIPSKFIFSILFG